VENPKNVFGEADKGSQGFHRPASFIPVPQTVSAEAQQWLQEIQGDKAAWRVLQQGMAGGSPESQRLPLQRFRELCAVTQQAVYDRAIGRFAVSVKEEEIGGVPVFVVTPRDGVRQRNKRRVLINTHGNARVLEVLYPIEAVPIASVMGVEVVVVRFRVAPEHRFPVPVDDVLAVYDALLESHPSAAVGVYGGSSGATLAAQLVSRACAEGKSLPGALGFLSGHIAISVAGDTKSTNADLDAFDAFLSRVDLPPNFYIGGIDPADPLLSPLHAGLERFPPCIIVSGTRDIMLSQCALLHRALWRSKVEAQLHVFEAMPHVFWYNTGLPESKQVFELVARFFDEKLA
jgi:acetyl esterase/lipase